MADDEPKDPLLDIQWDLGTFANETLDVIALGGYEYPIRTLKWKRPPRPKPEGPQTYGLGSVKLGPIYTYEEQLDPVIGDLPKRGRPE